MHQSIIPTGTHFTACYTPGRTQVYTYDSMHHNGYSVCDKDMKFETHVMGRKPKLLKGFIIWEAIYHLRGDIAAQDKFYEIRTKKCAARYHLYFSERNLDKPSTVSYYRAGLHEMEKKRRTWMFQPKQAATTEYLSTTIPSHPLAQDGPESEEETIPPVQKILSSTILQGTQSPSQESLPDSDFALNCHCGVTANANVVYLHEDGEAVQCDECGEWLHIACQ